MDADEEMLRRMDADEETMQNAAKELLEFFLNFENSEEMLYTSTYCKQTILEREPNDTEIVQNMVQLLRDRLMHHDWSSVAKLLGAIIIQQVPREEKVVTRAAMSVLVGHPGSSPQVYASALTSMKHLRQALIQELELEHALYLLSDPRVLTENKHLLQEAQEALMNPTPTKKGFARHEPSESIRRIEFIRRACLGIIEYAQWKKTLKSLSEIDKSSQERLGLGTQATLEQTCHSHAVIAVRSFQPLFSEEGRWEACLSKYIELCEYLGLTAEVHDAFAHFLPSDNPDLHRMHYNFLQKQEETTQEELKEKLRRIVELSPADELAVVAVDLLQESEEELIESLRIMFNLMDYPCWCQNHELWGKLFKCLQRVSALDTVNATQSIRECWDIRKHWWPQYQFVHFEDGEQMLKILNKYTNHSE